MLNDAIARLGQNGAPDQSLEDHLFGVANLCCQRTSRIGLPLTGELMGLAHDLGKYSAAFQAYIRSIASSDMQLECGATRGSVDHSTAGAQIVYTELRAQDSASACRVEAELLAIAIASHHTGLIDCLQPDGRDDLTRRLNKSDADTHCTEVQRKLHPAIRTRIIELLTDIRVATELRLALLRISPGRTTQPVQRGLFLRLLFSCLIDADRTNTADFEKPREALLRQAGTYAAWETLANRLEQHLAGFPKDGVVNAARVRISQHCLDAAYRDRGAYTLTVPTGGGKTLASLRFALQHARHHVLERIIYVSPYISIVDQNAQAVRAILEPPTSPFASIVLEHHSNLTGPKDTWRGAVLAENWDAPVVFTTAVQVLESLFGGGTRSVRRMHAMVNAVVVFDEVQTLPVRMTHLFSNAVNFLVKQCGSTVLLCTATQPLLHTVDGARKADNARGAVGLAPQAELMPDARALFQELKRHTTHDHTRVPGGWLPDKVAALAIEEMIQLGSCLVIVNTKRDAREIFLQASSQLKASGEKMSSGCLIHLSTHMCPAHRLDSLSRMKTALHAQERVLCVSTQLIEAGVDIDFAVVIRDLAGLDSIAQAAGRCNRNGKRPSLGRVHIVKLATELPKALNEILQAQRVTQRILAEWNANHGTELFDPADPDQMNTYFTYYFFNRLEDMTYPVRQERNDTLLNMLGRNHLSAADTQPPNPRRGGMMQSFKTAGELFRPIDGTTQGVVVPFREAGKDMINTLFKTSNVQEQFRLLRAAQQFTVNALPHELRSLQAKGALKEVPDSGGIVCLQEGFYSDAFGLALEGKEVLESLIA